MKLELRWAEIRFEEDTTRQSPGRIVGVLGVYGERASDRPEMVMAGAFTFPDGGVVVNRQHERKSPIVRVHPRIDGNVVRVDQPLLDTTAGRDAAVEIRGGLMTGLSVEMYVKEERQRNGIREIISAYVPRAALVDSSSYLGATVEVRERLATARRRLWL